MSELRKSLRSYLALRRALGFKLKTQGYLLHRFVDFADEQGASFITRDLALRWAMASPTGRRLNVGGGCMSSACLRSIERTQILGRKFRREDYCLTAIEGGRPMYTATTTFGSSWKQPCNSVHAGAYGPQHSPRCLDYSLSPACGSANVLH